MNALQPFRDAVLRRHDYAREWKARTGGKTVGFLCTYVPEEILYAAEILPVRVLGGHEPQDVTEPYITGRYCAFCRDCLAQGLLGKYEYLDGLVHAHSCIHIAQTFSWWQKLLPLDYSHFIYMPAQVQSPRVKECLVAELREFKASLERWLGRPISPQDLSRAVAAYNENRRLLWRLYELRKAEPPYLWGSEAMEVTVAATYTEKREHSRWLRRLIEEAMSREDRPSPAVRLMLIGGEFDDIEFLKLVEELGGNVVVDDHCLGTRYFWNEVPQDGDPIEALAIRYLERSPCPQKDWVARRRLDIISRLAEEWRVQGAILAQQKFCDPHEYDLPVIRDFLEGRGIPCLFLEMDVTLPAGQFRTRLEAFLETFQLGF